MLSIRSFGDFLEIKLMGKKINTFETTFNRNFACNEKLHLPHTYTKWTVKKKTLERTMIKGEIPLSITGWDFTIS